MNREEIEKEISKVSDHQVYIAYAIIYFIAILSTIIIAFQITQAAILIAIGILLCAIPVFFVPLIIRKCVKKVLSNTMAIVYTIISAILVILINGGHFNILQLFYLILPYYFLTNKPIIVSKKIKNLRNQLENCSE